MRVRKQPARSAATTIEFAFVIPIFITFIFALVELGRSFMATHLLANAARVGCRQGILANKTTDNITAAVNQQLSAQGISNPTIVVKVNGTVADASTAKSNDEINVIVTTPASSVTWIPAGWFTKGTLGGQYTLRRE
jgi:Flp pilus assembly protein TadG